MATKRFDLVVWGATGFTGTLVCEYLVKKDEDFSWAIAGRSRSKLEAVKNQISEINPEKAKAVEILIGDAGDQDSVDEVVKQTSVIISTAGPFNKYGTPVVDACVRFGTDYCDITGEYPWVHKIVETYHERAKEAGVRIVPCCGYDSIPSDLGAFMLVDYIKNELHEEPAGIKLYVSKIKGGASGGTISSMINIIETTTDTTIHTNSYLLKNTESEKKQPLKPEDVAVRGLSYDKEVGAWTAPNVMAAINTKIVHRSSSLLNYGPKFTYNEVMSYRRFFPALMVFGGLAIFVFLMLISFTRALLMKFLPSPGQGPSKKEREEGFFHMIVLGKTTGSESSPAKTIVGAVKGVSDPGYGETSKMLSEAALCLCFDKKKSPAIAGVLTPASAMGKPLIQRLRDAKMVFEVSK